MIHKPLFAAVLTGNLFLLSGCAGNKSHMDPCGEMVVEADGIRDIERQLVKNAARIRKARAINDTGELNSELKMRDALLDKKKYAQFAADKMRADCVPALMQEPPPVDQTRYREERQKGK